MEKQRKKKEGGELKEPKKGGGVKEMEKGGEVKEPKKKGSEIGGANVKRAEGAKKEVESEEAKRRWRDEGED